MTDDLVVSLERITDPNELMFLLTTHYNVYQDNAELLHAVARKCQQIELYQQAEFFINQALCLQPQNPVLKENQRYLFEQMIDRWHFLMLNDIQRNSSYFKAILYAIRHLSCETVLDIGSGTGILRYQCCTNLYFISYISQYDGCSCWCKDCTCL